MAPTAERGAAELFGGVGFLAALAFAVLGFLVAIVATVTGNDTMIVVGFAMMGAACVFGVISSVLIHTSERR